MVARCCPTDLAASGGGTDKPAASRVRPHWLFQRDLGIDLFCVTDTPVPCVNKVAEDDDVRITVSGPDAAGHGQDNHSAPISRDALHVCSHDSMCISIFVGEVGNCIHCSARTAAAPHMGGRPVGSY